MTKVLNLESREKNHFNKIKWSSLDAVFPFGEGERSFVSNYFATSQISPLTKERKEEIRKELIEFDKQF